MKRQIKFRAWISRKEDSSDCGWYDVDLTDSSNIGVFNVNYDYILCQYTGLKDKNGKEIYEGDIVEQVDLKMVVKFRSGCFMFATKDDNEAVYNPYATDFHYAIEQYSRRGIEVTDTFTHLEVIGNIFENPELIQSNYHEAN